MENKNIHNDDWLSNLPKDSGFDVPKGYFDSVEDEFSARLREESLPDASGFDVPEGYFDGLEDVILSKVELPKHGKVIPLRTRILRISSIAAVFAVMLTVYFSVPNDVTTPSSDEIAAWIDENIHDIDTEYIVGAFDEDTTLDESFFEDSLEDNTIENYLDEDDTYILIEESPSLFNDIN
jgi:hypothetical protein